MKYNNMKYNNITFVGCVRGNVKCVYCKKKAGSKSLKIFRISTGNMGWGAILPAFCSKKHFLKYIGKYFW